MKIILKEVNSIITKTKLPAADYVINPYIGCTHKCIYCYAEFMSRFSGITEPWGNYIVVKDFQGKIAATKLKGKRILLSSVTDAYQPLNQKYNKTRAILLQLKKSDCNVEILTKSKYLMNDIELIKQIPNIKIGVSLSTLDDSLRKKIEPGASTVSERIEMLEKLHQEGINCYLFISPIFPGLSDCKGLIKKTKNFVNEIWFENLNLRGGYKQKVLNLIKADYPEYLSLYENIYMDGNDTYWKEYEDNLKDMYPDYFKTGKFKLFFYHSQIKK